MHVICLRCGKDSCCAKVSSAAHSAQARLRVSQMVLTGGKTRLFGLA